MRTLDDMLTALGTADLPLLLAAPGGAPKPGYHVTELRLADRQVLDCGGVLSTETRAEVQIMPGFGQPMTARRFAKIAAQAMREIPGVDAAPLVAEVPTPEGHIMLHQITEVRQSADSVTLALAPLSPACRVVERRRQSRAVTSCCGIGAGAVSA